MIAWITNPVVHASILIVGDISRFGDIYRNHKEWFENIRFGNLPNLYFSELVRSTLAFVGEMEGTVELRLVQWNTRVDNDLSL